MLWFNVRKKKTQINNPKVEEGNLKRKNGKEDKKKSHVRVCGGLYRTCP